MKRARMAIWLAAAVAVGAFLVPQSPAQANMLVNPGFEASGGSYDGWTTFGSGPQLSLPGGDNIIRTGAAAAKIFGEFNGCPDYPVFSVGGAFQSFTPTPGAVYEFSGYSFVSVGDTIPGTSTCTGNRLIAKIVFYNAASGGSEIATNEVILGDWSTPRDQWIHFSVSAPAPSTALRVQAMLLFLQPACDAGAVFVDDTSFDVTTPASETNVLVNPSFDTSLTGWKTFGNVYYDSRAFARRTPTGAAKMFGTFTPDSPSGMYQVVPADDGSVWKLRVHSMTTCVESPITGANQNFVLGRIVFKDSVGGEIGGADMTVRDAASPLGTWTEHEVYAEAPAGTDSVAAYLLFIQPALEDGAVWLDDALLHLTGWAGVPDGEPSRTPATLHQNVPNPFNPRTRIAFEIPATGHVDVSVYNAAGRLVSTVYSGELAAGPQSVWWDGTTADGRTAASGVYWCVLTTEDGRTSRSMVLLK